MQKFKMTSKFWPQKETTKKVIHVHFQSTIANKKNEKFLNPNFPLSGSMYMWNPILDRIIKITMAPGSGYLKTIKTHVEALEQAFQVKDDAALSQIFGTIGPLYKRAQPNILNKKLGDVVYKAGEACIQVSKKLKTTGMTLVELAIFEKQALTEISALLPKAPKHH